jgi:hypothetical protein
VVQRKHSSSYRTVLVTAIIINYELIARAKKRGAFASLSSPPRHPHANHQPRPLFHYAIFSDNVLATSCVVPSVVAWVREGRSWDCHEERARRGVGVELALSLCVWMCGCGRRFNKGFFLLLLTWTVWTSPKCNQLSYIKMLRINLGNLVDPRSVPLPSSLAPFPLQRSTHVWDIECQASGA